MSLLRRINEIGNNDFSTELEPENRNVNSQLPAKMSTIAFPEDFETQPSYQRQYLEKIIHNLNENIANYNEKKNKSEKREILNQMQSYMRTVNHELPDSAFEQWESFWHMQGELFTAIQSKPDDMGREPTSDPTSLPEILANMSMHKVGQLLRILNTSIYDQLSTLYDREDNSNEANNFRTFLENHYIWHLSGSNAKNFVIESKVTSKKQILKVDNRFDVPRFTEDKLRAKKGLKSRFVSVYSERRACYEAERGENISRHLLVTDYCDNGSLESYGKKLQGYNLLNSGGEIFAQMARILLDFQKYSCLFMDAKLANWLVDSDENILISDTKSFVDQSLIFSREELLGSKFLIPPEISPDYYHFPDETLSVDAIHAYILGKNLYFFLGGRETREHDGVDFDFTDPVFKTAKGGEFKDMIIGLVNSDQGRRMSVQNAYERLFFINNPEFVDIVEKIEKVEGKSETNKKIVDFIRAKKQEVIDNPDKKQEILADLKHFYKERLLLEKSPFKKFTNIVPEKVKNYFKRPEKLKIFHDFRPELEEIVSALRQLDFGKEDAKIEDYINKQVKKFDKYAEKEQKQQEVLEGMKSKVEERLVNIALLVNGVRFIRIKRII